MWASCITGWPLWMILARIYGPAIVAREDAMLAEMFTEAERKFLFGRDHRRPLAR